MITGTPTTAGTAPAAPLSTSTTRAPTTLKTAIADLHSFLTSKPNGTVVAQQRAVNDLVQGRKRAATVGSRLSCHRLHRESAGRVQERHRTHRQWTATGESQWSAQEHQGKQPLRHERDVDDLDMHNNGRVNNITKNCTCGIFTAREGQHENRPQEPSVPFLVEKREILPRASPRHGMYH